MTVGADDDAAARQELVFIFCFNNNNNLSSAEHPFFFFSKIDVSHSDYMQMHHNKEASSVFMNVQLK